MSVANAGEFVGVFKLLGTDATKVAAIFRFACHATQAIEAGVHSKGFFGFGVGPFDIIPSGAGALNGATASITVGGVAVAMSAARRSGIGGDVHEHVFAVHAGVVATDVANVVHRAALRPDVAHHSFRIGAIESSVGILERFFIATSKHIEASGKCIGSSLIEVIFGHFVVAIVYERQTKQEVFFNMLVGFVESATFVVRLHFGFRLRDVGNTLEGLI